MSNINELASRKWWSHLAKARWWRNLKKTTIPKSSSIKNSGFIRSKWTEIIIEDEEETPNRYDVKKEIFDMMRIREQQAFKNPRYDLIRVNRKTNTPVEVNNDRNGRTLYAPILHNGKLENSFTVETRSPCESDNEDRTTKQIEEELIEVEFPHVSFSSWVDQEPGVKVNVDIEIIKPKAIFNKVQNSGKSYQFFKSRLTKDELIKLITDEVRIEGDQIINLINFINQASLSEAQEELPSKEESEQRLDEIRSELKRMCIKIESKGLAECKQTDITSHKIEMTDNKPIGHRVRPVQYPMQGRIQSNNKGPARRGYHKTKHIRNMFTSQLSVKRRRFTSPND